MDPLPPKVIAKKGQKHPTIIGTGNKSQVTVLACASAAGYCMPPLVIFDQLTLKGGMDSGEVPGTMYGLSENGWMNQKIFGEWFSHHFLMYAPPVRPLLLLMDGHSTHFTPEFINKAAEEDVIVLCLPPNTTHKSQPLDKGPFSPLKMAWREECHKYMLLNPGKVVSKYSFSIVFGKAWLRGMTPSNIISGFKTTGIYPINRKALLHEDEAASVTKTRRIPFLNSLSPNPVSSPPKTPAQVQPQVHLHFYPSTPHAPIGKELQSNALSSNPVQSDLPIRRDSFTASEIARFERRREEGFDIGTDKHYNQWLKQQDQCILKLPLCHFLHPQPMSQVSMTTHPCEPVKQLQPCGILSKLLEQKKSQMKMPKLSKPSSTARIITSEENQRQLREKEEKKIAEARRKELAKIERERKKKEREEKRRSS